MDESIFALFAEIDKAKAEAAKESTMEEKPAKSSVQQPESSDSEGAYGAPESEEDESIRLAREKVAAERAAKAALLEEERVRKEAEAERAKKEQEAKKEIEQKAREAAAKAEEEERQRFQRENMLRKKEEEQKKIEKDNIERARREARELSARNAAREKMRREAANKTSNKQQNPQPKVEAPAPPQKKPLPKKEEYDFSSEENLKAKKMERAQEEEKRKREQAAKEKADKEAYEQGLIEARKIKEEAAAREYAEQVKAEEARRAEAIRLQKQKEAEEAAFRREQEEREQEEAQVQAEAEERNRIEAENLEKENLLKQLEEERLKREKAEELLKSQKAVAQQPQPIQEDFQILDVVPTTGKVPISAGMYKAVSDKDNSYAPAVKNINSFEACVYLGCAYDRFNRRGSFSYYVVTKGKEKHLIHSECGYTDDQYEYAFLGALLLFQDILKNKIRQMVVVVQDTTTRDILMQNAMGVRDNYGKTRSEYARFMRMHNGIDFTGSFAVVANGSVGAKKNYMEVVVSLSRNMLKG